MVAFANAPPALVQEDYDELLVMRPESKTSLTGSPRNTNSDVAVFVCVTMLRCATPCLLLANRLKENG